MRFFYATKIIIAVIMKETRKILMVLFNEFAY